MILRKPKQTLKDNKMKHIIEARLDKLETRVNNMEKRLNVMTPSKAEDVSGR